jgi:hypothetical protein
MRYIKEEEEEEEERRRRRRKKKKKKEEEEEERGGEGEGRGRGRGRGGGIVVIIMSNHVNTLYIVIDLFSNLKMLGAYFVLGRFPVNTKNNNINNKE